MKIKKEFFALLTAVLAAASMVFITETVSVSAASNILTKNADIALTSNSTTISGSISGNLVKDEEITVTLNLAGNKNLGGAEIELAYAPSDVKYIEGSLEEKFADAAVATDVVNNGNSIKFTLVFNSPSDYNGTIAKIKFKVTTSAKKLQFTTKATLADIDYNKMNVKAENISLEEKEETKYPNRISGLSACYNKNIQSSAFQLSPKAYGTIKYKTSNSKVATVTSKGLVTVRGIGTAHITITAGDEKYETVQKKIKVRVVPAAVKMNYIKSNAKKALSVKWDKMSGVSGFKLQYSNTKDFKKVKTSYVGGSRHSKTRSDLVSGKKYYVRVCAYKKIGKSVYQGDWSTVRIGSVK